MSYNFKYVPRSKYLPVKKELERLINAVQNEVRECFTFSFTYVGSTHRKLITEDLRGNVGYDFDVNIHVNDENEDYTAEEIRTKICNAFNKFVKQFGYDYCEDSTRVLTIKRKDILRSRIISSCDFAIVYDCKDGRRQYIHFNKKQKTYDWEFLPISNMKLEDKAEAIRNKGCWDEVRNLYLDKKNLNENPNKRSRSLYAETINEIYHRCVQKKC